MTLNKQNNKLVQNGSTIEQSCLGEPCSCAEERGEETTGSCLNFCEGYGPYNNVVVSIMGITEAKYDHVEPENIENEGTAYQTEFRIGGWKEEGPGELYPKCDEEGLMKNYEKGLVPFPPASHKKYKEIIPAWKGTNDEVPGSGGYTNCDYAQLTSELEQGFSGAKIRPRIPCNKFWNKIYHKKTCPTNKNAHPNGKDFTVREDGWDVHPAPSDVHQPGAHDHSFTGSVKDFTSFFNPTHFSPTQHWKTEHQEKVKPIHRAQFGDGSCIDHNAENTGSYELCFQRERIGGHYNDDPSDDVPIEPSGDGNAYKCWWSYTFPNDVTVGFCGLNGKGNQGHVVGAPFVFGGPKGGKNREGTKVWRHYDYDNPASPPSVDGYRRLSSVRTHEADWNKHKDPWDSQVPGKRLIDWAGDYRRARIYFVLSATTGHIDECTENDTWRKEEETKWNFNNDPIEWKWVGGMIKHALGPGYKWNPPYCRVFAQVYIGELSPQDSLHSNDDDSMLCAAKMFSPEDSPFGFFGMKRFNCNNIDISGLTNCRGVFPMAMNGSGNPYHFPVDFPRTTRDGINPNPEIIGTNLFHYRKDWCDWGCNVNDMTVSVKSVSNKICPPRIDPLSPNGT